MIIPINREWRLRRLRKGYVILEKWTGTKTRWVKQTHNFNLGWSQGLLIIGEYTNE